ncbi:hypothetical protein LZD49_26320 [Dyadobacter sp. CY261]|uniref:hypothetical protein n=1 Tax=Dyadobacter sp. CY261 TaxID=2907203 RepID=UPI001F3836DF|nr:hypothetical protein [Dyadobacter sp. CY261]MCF0074025.1 hypothetical protein [Dyadobacter sp. CY261]
MEITLNNLILWAAQFEAVISENALGWAADRKMSELSSFFEGTIKSNKKLREITAEAKELSFRLIYEGDESKQQLTAQLGVLRSAEARALSEPIEEIYIEPVVVKVEEAISEKFKRDAVTVGVLERQYTINPYSAFHNLIKAGLIKIA